MKRVLFFGLLLTGLISCSSKEKKAEKLINQDLFETLYDYSSYQSVKMEELDSAFTSIYSDSTIIHNVILYQIASKKFDELTEEANEALSDLTIWGGSYGSYGRSKYNDAKERSNKALENMKRPAKVGDSIRGEIVKNIKNFNPEYIGYKTAHTFRAKNLAGNYGLSTIEYVFDEKINSILHKKEIKELEYTDDKIWDMTAEEAINYFSANIDIFKVD